jgi:hypothetical protein
MGQALRELAGAGELPPASADGASRCLRRARLKRSVSQNAAPANTAASATNSSGCARAREAEHRFLLFEL